MVAEEITKALFPVVAWIDDIHQVGEHCKRVIESFSVMPVEVGQQGKGAMGRHHPGNGELPVPKPGMMGTVVPYNAQMVDEGDQIHLIHVVDTGNGVAVLAMSKVRIPLGELAESHDLTQRPDRRQILVVGGAEMPDENLGTLLDNLFQVIDIFLIMPARFEQAGVQVSMRPVSASQPVSQVGAERDLESFYCIQDQQPQLPVKDVVFDHLVEGGSRLEIVRGVVLLEGEPVCGQTVVIQVREITAGATVVVDSHPA